MRQRLGNVEDIQRAAYAFAALATGSPVDWENHDPNDPTESLLAVFERATGFDRARQDDIGGNGPLMPECESTEEILAELQEAGCSTSSTSGQHSKRERRGDRARIR